MAAESERSVVDRSIEVSKAYGGTGLSYLSSRFAVVRSITIGPENEDGHLPATYPLTPLFYRVIKTRLDELSPGVLARHRRELKGNRPPEWRPRDFPYAGVNSVPVDAIRPREGEESRPVVIFPVGNQILAAPIPDRHLEDIPQGDDFFWAMRYIERGDFGIGKLYAGRLAVEEAARAIETMYPHQVEAGRPSY